MKFHSLVLFGLSLAITESVHAADSAKQFLRYIYGAENVVIENASWPNDDLWMLHGRKNDAGIAEIESAKISQRNNDIIWETIQNAVCIVEVRDGKVDPAFNLDQSYTRHRELVLRFVYASLRQDRDELRAITTNAENVKFGRAKAPPMGDMDVYQEIIAHLPVVRTSAPATDKTLKSVTYRVPLSAKGLPLRLVRRDGDWRIDTDATTQVPLEFFFQ